MSRQAAAGADVVGVLDDLGRAAPVRRGDAGEGVAAVEGLEERRLLAVQVLVGALEHAEVDAFGPTGPLHLDDGGAQARHLGDEGALQPEDNAVRFHDPGRDEGAFDDCVGVEAHDRAVLGGAGLAFGPVDDHRGRQHVGRVLAYRPPLAPSGETGAPAPAQTGRLDDGDQRCDVLMAGRVDAAPASSFDVLLEGLDGLRREDAVDERHSPVLSAATIPRPLSTARVS